MSKAPLMPKATAVWLVDNTALTFRQIADFCQMHELEVKGVADGEVAQGIKGLDPIASNQLTREEIEKAEGDAGYRLKLAESNVKLPPSKTKKTPRYTPVSRRQDRPDAIAWLLRYHPELAESQIIKLVGTTKPTIHAIRDRTHWNSANIKPVDPVTLGLCTQLDLDFAVQKAAKRAGVKPVIEAQPGIETIRPTEETLAPDPSTRPVFDEAPRAPAPVEDQPQAADVFGSAPAEPVENPIDEDQEEDIDAESVFAKLKDLKLPQED